MQLSKRFLEEFEGIKLRLDSIESSVTELNSGCERASSQIFEAEKNTTEFLEKLQQLEKERYRVLGIRFR